MSGHSQTLLSIVVRCLHYRLRFVSSIIITGYYMKAARKIVPVSNVVKGRGFKPHPRQLDFPLKLQLWDCVYIIFLKSIYMSCTIIYTFHGWWFGNGGTKTCAYVTWRTYI